MVFQLLFIASPLLLCGGLLIKNKGLCCLYCGAIFFLFSAFGFSDFFCTTYPALGADMSVYQSVLSPAFIYGAQLISMIFPHYSGAVVLYGLITAFGLMLYIYKYCYYTAFSAVIAAVSGLWLISFIDPFLFSGMVIAAFAFRYASEKRFIRFLAVILLAACFDLRILFIAPLFILFIIKPTVYYIPAAAVLATVLIFVDISPVFGFFPGFTFEREAAQLFYPVTIAAAGVLTAITAKILIRRGSYSETMITVMAVAAAFAVGSFADGRLLFPSVICFFPAALTLVPEIIAVAKTIITLTFRENKRTVLMVGGVILGIGLMAYHIVLISGSGYEYVPWFVSQAV